MAVSTPSVAPDPGGTGHPTRPSGWTVGRLLAITAASLVVLVSLGVAVGGVGLLVVDKVARDDAGFVMTGERQLTTDTYALTSSSFEIETTAAPDSFPDRMVGDITVTAEPRSGPEVFVGIASTADVEAYLGSARHAQVESIERPAYEQHGDGALTGTPGAQDFWVAEASGSGSQALTWNLTDGDWTVVVMNADGSAGVDVDVAAGAELPALEWLAPLAIGLGVLGAGLGFAAVTLVVRRAGR